MLLGRRARAMRLVLVLVFAALVLRLVAVQEFSHQHYAALSASELTQTVTVPAVRGGVSDRNGEVLAETVTKQTVVADPLLITHPAPIAAALSPVLGVPTDQLRAELEKDPPVLIVGKFFDYLGDGTRKLIAKGWHVVLDKPVEIRERNK